MSVIRQLRGLEILDSRGRPTVQATCVLESGAVGTASVPSGASTGQSEALELRDGDLSRFRGLGCLKAVAHINEDLHQALRGQSFGTQAELDARLIELDGTPNKSRLGANALLGVSLAFARARAVEQQIPLYQYFHAMTGYEAQAMPRPMINLFSGGKHAGGQIPIQDVQVLPLRAATTVDVLAVTYEVFQTAAELMREHFGMRLLTADEGGLAPAFESAEAMLATAVAAIERAGYRPGEDVALTVDVAASHFYRDGKYHLSADAILDGSAMVARLRQWLDDYPIVSLEDGLAEDDWPHWRELYTQTHERIMILGDDLLCTNPRLIQQAQESQAANALLLKVNQIGTLSEAAQSLHLAKKAGWRVVVSARSGETEDHWLADLAVGWAGDYIKVGAITQSERLAKYNRLLQIEAER